jgi:hypothetical protein
MSADFDVRAQLTLDSRGAFTGAQRLSSSMATLGQQLSGAQGMAGGLVGRLMGVGAAYLGLNAGIGVFKGLTHSAVSYTSELEATKIGLQSILQSVEGGSWDEAGKKAESAFEKIKQASIASPASAQEMFGIFTGILGPIEGAGFGMEKVVDMTNDAVLAASALNVDYAQASRDISMMARGAAGVDVKLFSLLRSTNAIKETAEQWNKKLTAAQRVEKLSAALAKFHQSGDAFGRSWKGVTSTFQGVWQEASRAFMTPIMQMAAQRIGRANDYLIKNQEKTADLFEVYGERIASKLEFAWEKGTQGAHWVIDNWGLITRTIDDTMAKVYHFAPILLHAAKIYAGVSIGTNVAGKGLQIGAGAISAGGMAASGMAKLLGVFGGVGGAGAGAAGAATAGVGAVAATETAAAGAAAATAAVSIGAVAAGLILVASMGEPVVDNWKAISKATVTTADSVWTSFVDMGKSVWAGLQGPIYLVGSLVTGFGQLLVTGLGTSLTLAANAVRWFFDGLEPISTAIYEVAVPAMKELAAWIRDLAQTVDSVTGRTTVMQASEGPQKWDEWQASENTMAAILAGPNTAQASEAKRQKDLAKQKTTVHNDFRGSQIKIDQKFDGDADPDRIVVGMMQDLTRQAEMRLSSGYASPFSR